MATAGLVELRAVDVFSHPVAEVVRIEPAAVAGEEERGFARADLEERPTFLEVGPA